MTRNHIILLSSIHLNMSAVASPSELTEQPQDEGSTAAEIPFLYAPTPR